jgi:hypothetical protein
MSREPVAVFILGFDAVVAAGLSAASALGWISLSGDQVAAVVGFVTVLSGLVVAALRSRVVPVGRVEEIRATAFQDGLFTPVPVDDGLPLEVGDLPDDGGVSDAGRNGGDDLLA